MSTQAERNADNALAAARLKRVTSAVQKIAHGLDANTRDQLLGALEGQPGLCCGLHSDTCGDEDHCCDECPAATS